MNKIKIIAGPTASGKTKKVLEIASYKENVVIINADSLQVYREVPILTAQPSIEELNTAEHKLYGFISYRDDLRINAYGWAEKACLEINKAINEEKSVIIVGGSGMYILGLIEGFSYIPGVSEDIRESAILKSKNNYEDLCELVYKNDPNLRKIITKDMNRQMIRAYEILLQTGNSISFYWNFPKKKFLKDVDFEYDLIMPERTELYERINSRFLSMIDQGAVEEVEKLIEKTNGDTKYPAYQAIGVLEIKQYIQKDISYDDMIDRAQRNSRHYAKRQITWFKKYGKI